MQKRVCCAAAAVVIAGCGGTTPLVVKPQEANIGVATTCVQAVPPSPVLLSDAEWAAPPDEFKRLQALKIDRGRLLQSNAELRATLKACAVKP